MKDTHEKIPDQKKLEQELNTYLERKYGDKVKLVVSTLVPKVSPEQEGDKGKQSEKASSQINFDMKPEELISYLNSFIVKQDEAKEILATKVCTHYNKIKFMAERVAALTREWEISRIISSWSAPPEWGRPI